MRILVTNYHRTLVGGIETYLATVLPPLAVNNELLFVAENAAPTGHESIPLPAGVKTMTLEKGVENAIQQIADWQPDIAFMHVSHAPKFQRQVVTTFPTVAFAHGYYGLCISGSKTWSRPVAQPCQKDFDWKCLLQFHAKGCGGDNPLTMARDYLLHTRQLETLKGCKAILTHGGQMQQEYVRQGIPADRVIVLPHFVDANFDTANDHALGAVVKLLFVGRFDELKGGRLLLQALPTIAEKLSRTVELKMVGAGPATNHWKQIAQGVTADKVRVEFTGWLDREAVARAMAESDLLVVPSVWPEPFGQVGLEAANVSLPAVAFDVGGIPTWLRDGVNGHLARANPPTPRGLAEAITKALGNREHYEKLRAGALQVAQEFSAERHLDALNDVFEKVAGKR